MNINDLKLSVLDVGIIRSNQSASNAFSSMIALAQHAEKLGYHRYWLGEHHNVAGVVASQTAVFAAAVGARTSHIRIGGCVLLPHYTPLLIAEQMSTLEACYPGRVDLGLGRSSGTDGITSQLLRGARKEGLASQDPAESIQHLLAMLRPDGVKLQDNSPDYILRATSNSTSSPEVWMLSTSSRSAKLAAELGLPYSFGYHIQGDGIKEAIDLYRSKFKPSVYCSEPKVLISAIVVLGENAEEAERLSIPQLWGMCALRSGEPVSPILLAEQADTVIFPERYKSLVQMFKKTWIIGSPEQAADQIARLVTWLGIDEIMVNPVAASYTADDPSRAPNRERTLTLLAEQLHSK